MFKITKLSKRWERVVFLALELVITLVLFLVIEVVSENTLLLSCVSIFKGDWTTNTVMSLAMLSLITLSIVFLYVLAQYKWRPPSFEITGRMIGKKSILRSAIFYKNLISVLLFIFAFSFLLGLMTNGHDQVSVAQQVSVNNLKNSWPIKVDTLISSLIFAPFIEELFFRYGIFWIANQLLVLITNNWRQGTDTNSKVMFLSAGISSVFFAVIHSAISFSGFMIYWVMGMGFSFMYIKYRSIWAATFTHIVWNLAAISVVLL